MGEPARASAADPGSPAAPADEKRSDDKPITVIAAMLANLTIAVAKFVAAAISGSAAMFAEGVHSVVDTCNQGLLLVGARRSNKPADQRHPFGYGKEIYFWTLIYSVLLFGIGGGVAVFKGVTDLRNPSEPGDPTWSYAVLGVAFLAEGTSWLIAVRKVRQEENGRSFAHKLLTSKDPAKYVVVGEDSAALVGILVAFAGIGASQLLGSPIPDAIASIVIGALLGGIAVSLAAQTKKLLVGSAAEPETVEAIQELTERHGAVEEAGLPLTLHMGPQDVVVAINIKFRRDLSTDELARAVDEIEASIREAHPEVSRIYVEAQLFHGDIEREEPDVSE